MGAAEDPLAALNTIITEEVEAADEAVEITIVLGGETTTAMRAKSNEQKKDLLGETIQLLQL